MTAFKVGDKVRCVSTVLDDGDLFGKEGVVTKVDGNAWPYAIDVDGQVDVPVSEDEIELIPFKVGDKVKIKGSVAYPTPHVGEHGVVIEVDDLYSSWPYRVLVDSGAKRRFNKAELILIEGENTVAKTNVRFDRVVEVESAAIAKLYYSTSKRILLVEFKHGGRAAYLVSPLRFGRLVGDRSVGTAYNSIIKNASATNVTPLPIDSLNIGILEEPKVLIEEEFPVGTAVRVREGVKTTTVPAGTIGLVIEHRRFLLEVGFAGRGESSNDLLPQLLSANEVDKVE